MKIEATKSEEMKEVEAEPTGMDETGLETGIATGEAEDVPEGDEVVAMMVAMMVG